MPVFTYLANTIRVRDRQVPYSLVAGIESPGVAGFRHRADRPAGVRPGSDRGQTRVRPASDPSRRATGPWRAAARRARGRRDRPQRMDRSRARRTPRRSGHARVLPVGRGRRLAHGEGRLHAGGHRADCGRRRRPPARAGVSRHHAGRKRGRLGSAISAGAVASPSAGRAGTGATIARRPRPFSTTSGRANCGRHATATRPAFGSAVGPGEDAGAARGGAAAEPADSGSRQTRRASPSPPSARSRSAPRLARPTSASTSPTSASSSSSRRCCSWCCSSGSGSNSASGRSASCGRLDTRSAICNGCSPERPSPCRSPAACSASPARSRMPMASFMA